MTLEARTIRLVSLMRWTAVLANTAFMISTAVVFTQISGDTRSDQVAQTMVTACLGLVDFPASFLAMILAVKANDLIVLILPGLAGFACRITLVVGFVGLLGGLQYYWLAGVLGRTLFGREKTVALTWKTCTATAVVAVLLVGAAWALPWSALPKRASRTRDRSAYPAQPPAFASDSRKLQRSVVVPTLDTPLPEGKNAVWCATFQMAWDRLKNDVIGGPIQVAKAGAIADRLNQTPIDVADLPDDSYFAAAGRVKDGIINKIRKEMARRFQKEPFELEGELTKLVAYAYLRTGVPFKLAYSKGELDFTDSSGARTRVSSFGVERRGGPRSQEVRDQVEVLYFGPEEERYSPTELVLDLCRDSQPNQLILACLPRKATLQATLDNLEDKITHSKLDKYERRLGGSARLLVPCSCWRIAHHFNELEGGDRLLLNPGFEDLFVAAALQEVDFHLDQEGVRLESQARVSMAKSAAPVSFYFDRPFLIVVKKRGAKRPFFVMWIDNAELLSKTVQ